MTAILVRAAAFKGVRDRLEVLGFLPDLVTEYGWTDGQVEAVLAGVAAGDGIWEVPEWAVPLVACSGVQKLNTPR